MTAPRTSTRSTPDRQLTLTPSPGVLSNPKLVEIKNRAFRKRAQSGRQYATAPRIALSKKSASGYPSPGCLRTQRGLASFPTRNRPDVFFCSALTHQPPPAPDPASESASAGKRINEYGIWSHQFFVICAAIPTHLSRSSIAREHSPAGPEDLSPIHFVKNRPARDFRASAFPLRPIRLPPSYSTFLHFEPLVL